jgi:hypothetical protein
MLPMTKAERRFTTTARSRMPRVSTGTSRPNVDTSTSLMNVVLMSASSAFSVSLTGSM